jgi:hypothetical protein
MGKGVVFVMGSLDTAFVMRHGGPDSANPAALRGAMQKVTALVRLDTALSAMSIDTVLHRLFDGVEMSQAQQDQARTLLVRLTQEQRALDSATLPVRGAYLRGRADIAMRLDSTLATIVTDGDARAVMREHLGAPGQRAGRAGMGGVVAEVGGPRAGGPASASDAMFHRVFDSIPLTPAQVAAARAAIERSFAEQVALGPPPANAIVLRVLTRRVPPPGDERMVALGQAADSAIMGLMTTDEDRRTVRARIIRLVQPPRMP